MIERAHREHSGMLPVLIFVVSVGSMVDIKVQSTSLKESKRNIQLLEKCEITRRHGI
jgi:hypothetical protein